MFSELVSLVGGCNRFSKCKGNVLILLNFPETLSESMENLMRSVFTLVLFIIVSLMTSSHFFNDVSYMFLTSAFYSKVRASSTFAMTHCVSHVQTSPC